MSENPRALAADFIRFKADIAKLIDLENGRGLEVGPFDRPFFEKSETNVEYLDYRSAEDARIVAAAAPGHHPEFVVELDYLVSGSGEWTAVPDRAFDWILSSHALEHSPNLIGFLRMMTEKLRPGGFLISMLPDKRRTFDAYRPLTTLGRIFEDYYTDAKRPPFQAVFDHLFYNRPLSIAGADDVYSAADRKIVEGGDLGDSLMWARRAITDYVDAHNYVFTDNSFNTIIRTVCASGLLNLEPVLHSPTLDDEMTFLTILRKPS